jgi:hypothetical protein
MPEVQGQSEMDKGFVMRSTAYATANFFRQNMFLLIVRFLCAAVPCLATLSSSGIA